MPTRYIIAVSILIFPVTVLSQTAISRQPDTELASHLTAQITLARYATSYATGFEARDLGRRMEATIRQRAGRAEIQLPAPMSPLDRRLVEQLEGLRGDDFDVAYLDMLKRHVEIVHGDLTLR